MGIAHSGVIELFSERGENTRVWFYFIFDEELERDSSRGEKRVGFEREREAGRAHVVPRSIGSAYSRPGVRQPFFLFQNAPLASLCSDALCSRSRVSPFFRSSETVNRESRVARSVRGALTVLF